MAISQLSKLSIRSSNRSILFSMVCLSYLSSLSLLRRLLLGFGGTLDQTEVAMTKSSSLPGLGGHVRGRVTWRERYVCGGAAHTQLLIPPFRPLVTFLGFSLPFLTIQTSVRSMSGKKGRILMKMWSSVEFWSLRNSYEIPFGVDTKLKLEPI